MDRILTEQIQDAVVNNLDNYDGDIEQVVKVVKAIFQEHCILLLQFMHQHYGDPLLDRWEISPLGDDQIPQLVSNAGLYEIFLSQLKPIDNEI